MNGEITPRLSSDELDAARVAANVLESSAMIRAHQQEISDKLADIARRRIELEGSNEMQLFNEMKLMAERMKQLRDHPLRARFIGKSALAVISNEEHLINLRTEPVPDGMIGVHEDKELVLSGLVYRAGFFRDDPHYLQVNIGRLIENQNLREASETQKLYDLRTYQDDTGWRILPSGSEFRPLEEAKGNEYREHRAEMRKRMNDWRRKVRLSAMIESVGRPTGPERIKVPSDDMFLRPLALVMQGNMLLGAKRK